MRDLKLMFNPKSVAVVGASRDSGSVGYGVLRGLLRGGFFITEHCKPFPGKIYPVNPNATEIQGIKCYPNLKMIPGKIDLVIFSIPAKIVPIVMKEVIELKIKNAIIISAGFSEFGVEGKKLQNDLLDLVRGKVNIVGPNCLGILNPHVHLNASFAPTMPPKGKIGFITQSGALADSIIDWAVQADYGFSKIISFGNGMDLDAADYLDYLGQDPQTNAIALYLEGIKDGKKFMEVAKRVSKKKPIVAIKAGRTESGTHAISSHTGSLAGSYETFAAAFKQSGVFMAESVEEMFNFAKVFANMPPLSGDIAIITNGGGCGVLAADGSETLGLKLTKFSEKLLKDLDGTGKMHPAYSRRNPLDIVGDAKPDRYLAALDLVMADKTVSGAIILQTLQTMTDSVADAMIIEKIYNKYPNKPIICSFMGGKFSHEGVRHLESHGIPNFDDPLKAAKAMKALSLRYNQLCK